MKNYKVLLSMLKKEGFKLYKDGPHPIFIKNGKTVLVTKNVRCPKMILKKTLSYYEKMK